MFLVHFHQFDVCGVFDLLPANAKLAVSGVLRAVSQRQMRQIPVGRRPSTGGRSPGEQLQLLLQPVGQ
jgi:hypothetical protein